MEPSSLGRYDLHSSKRRVGDRPSLMDEDVVEISPPSSFAKSKSSNKKQKQKQVIFHEVIDVDNDEDEDLMIIEDKFVDNIKGKSCVNGYLGSLDVDSTDPVKLSKSLGSISHNVSTGGESTSTMSYLDDYHGDLDYNGIIFDDECAMLQAHFDSLDVPPGVEAAIPWWPSSDDSKNQGVSASTLPFLPPSSVANVGRSKLDDSLSSQTHKETSPSRIHSIKSKRRPVSISTFGKHPYNAPLASSSVANIGPSDLDNSLSSQTYKETSPTRIHSVKSRRPVKLSSVCKHPYTATLPPSSVANIGPSDLDDSKSSQTYKETSPSRIYSVKSKRRPVSVSSSGKQPYNAALQPTSSHLQLGSNTWTGHPLSAVVDPSWNPYTPFGNLSSKKSSLAQKVSSGATSPPTWWNAPSELNGPPSHVIQSNFNEAPTGGFAYFQDQSVVLDQGIAAEISVPSDIVSSHQQDNSEALIVKKLESFKKFDTVQDHSDHYYTTKMKKLSHPTKGWVKKIQEEWRILEKDLPDTIFVRVYETRMDLLRAAIVGAEGTPYHDGIFFFDVHFPSSYPNVPPLVYYRSGGLRLNPNLYNCGKVCLSLLNTWSGDGNEKWVPKLSTTLQILVSIQGLILNAKPYFNEPGYVGMQGSPAGEKQSEAYNEKTFLLSLKTMLYSMRKPPKYFEDFVFGHFYKKAHEILTACEAYLDGAQIGTLVKGGIQDVDAGDKSCSNTFKMHLPVYINNLVQVFTMIGVKGCGKYVIIANNNDPVAEMPSSSTRKLSTSSYRKKVGLELLHKM